jgi:hypothetical protein
MNQVVPANLLPICSQTLGSETLYFTQDEIRWSFDGCHVVELMYCYILLDDGMLLKFTMNGWLSVLKSNSTIVDIVNPGKGTLMIIIFQPK